MVFAAVALDSHDVRTCLVADFRHPQDCFMFFLGGGCKYLLFSFRFGEDEPTLTVAYYFLDELKQTTN